MHKKIFIANVFKMAFAMLGANISDICYSIYISSKSGAESMGIFHLVMSIYSFATVISVSGIGLTVTRLVADYDGRGAMSTVIRCMGVCALTSGISGLVIFLFSDSFSLMLIGSRDCGVCFRILSPSLLCISLSVVIRGYFTACSGIGEIIVSKLVSEVVLWGTTFVFQSKFKNMQAYVVVVSAMSVSLTAESVCNMVLWRRKINKEINVPGKTSYRAIVSLCVPVAVGSYLRTGLSSIENILVPKRLDVYAVGSSLAQYGIVKGMSLPVMMFPAVFTNAFSNLIVPEIARRRVGNKIDSLSRVSAVSVEYVLKYAFMISFIFFLFHKEICSMFYREKTAGIFLGSLSVLPVLMFTDTMIDSLLKGLDKQVSALKINIADSVLRVLAVFLFVPVYGIGAYIGVMYVSEIFNVICSYCVLKKACGMPFPVTSGIGHPVLSGIVASFVVRQVGSGSVVSQLFLFCCAYIILICILKNICCKIKDRQNSI